MISGTIVPRVVWMSPWLITLTLLLGYGWIVFNMKIKQYMYQYMYQKSALLCTLTQPWLGRKCLICYTSTPLLWITIAMQKLTCFHQPQKNNHAPSSLPEGAVWKMSYSFGINEFLPYRKAACLCHQNRLKGLLNIDRRQKVWKKVTVLKNRNLKVLMCWYLLAFFLWYKDNSK